MKIYVIIGCVRFKGKVQSRKKMCLYNTCTYLIFYDYYAFLFRPHSSSLVVAYFEDLGFLAVRCESKGSFFLLILRLKDHCHLKKVTSVEKDPVKHSAPD